MKAGYLFTLLGWVHCQAETIFLTMTPVGGRAKAAKLRIALSEMSVVGQAVAIVSSLVLLTASGRLHSGGGGNDLAVLGEEDVLADGELGRVNVKVNALDVADGGALRGGKVEEEVAALDGVGLDSALGAGADGDVDELVGEDEVDVGDLLVGGDEAGEGDLVVGGDVGEGVAALDDVGGAGSGGAGSVGGGSGGGQAGGVVGGGAELGDVEHLASIDQVGVGEAVELGDVANARVVERRERAESLAGHDGVGDGGVGTARESGGYVQVSRCSMSIAMEVSYGQLGARPWRWSRPEGW